MRSLLRLFLLGFVTVAAIPACGLGTVDLIENIIDEIDDENPPPPAAGDALVSIDVENGSREILSGLQKGGGTPFLDARSAVYDPPRDRILVWEEARAAIISVEGVDGDRQVFSDQTTGEGPALKAVRRMVIDDSGDRIIALDDSPTGALLVAVDLDTGDREILEDLEAGTPSLDTPRGLALNSSGSFAYIGDDERDTVVRIQLSNGDRATLSGGSAGAGPEFEGVRDLLFESDSNRLLLLDGAGSALFGIDLQGGARVLIADGPGGLGALLVDGAVLEIGGSAMTAYVGGGSEVWEVDTATGDGDRLTGKTVGSGPLQERIAGLALDTSRDRLIAVSRD